MAQWDVNDISIVDGKVGIRSMDTGEIKFIDKEEYRKMIGKSNHKFPTNVTNKSAANNAADYLKNVKTTPDGRVWIIQNGENRLVSKEEFAELIGKSNRKASKEIEGHTANSPTAKNSLPKPDSETGSFPEINHSSTDISITYSELEENIAKLKQAIANMKDAWVGEIKKNISTLDNSWVGEDCSAYLSRLSSMDGSIQNAISVLELLCSSYEKARDLVKDSQANVMSSIANLD